MFLLCKVLCLVSAHHWKSGISPAKRASRPLPRAPTFHFTSTVVWLDVHLLAGKVQKRARVWFTFLHEIRWDFTRPLNFQYSFKHQLISAAGRWSHTSSSSFPGARTGSNCALSRLSSPNWQETALARQEVFGLIPGLRNWTSLACYQVSLRGAKQRKEDGGNRRRKAVAF